MLELMYASRDVSECERSGRSSVSLISKLEPVVLSVSTSHFGSFTANLEEDDDVMMNHGDMKRSHSMLEFMYAPDSEQTFDMKQEGLSILVFAESDEIQTNNSQKLLIEAVSSRQSPSAQREATRASSHSTHVEDALHNLEMKNEEVVAPSLIVKRTREDEGHAQANKRAKLLRTETLDELFHTRMNDSYQKRECLNDNLRRVRFNDHDSGKEKYKETRDHESHDCVKQSVFATRSRNQRVHLRAGTYTSNSTRQYNFEQLILTHYDRNARFRLMKGKIMHSKCKNW